MNVATIAVLLRDRAQLRTHDGWTREEMLAYQARRLADLRAYAIEIVDEDNQPLPEGEYGAKTLVTVLFSQTQPLIRYELSDRIAAAPGMPGDLPFALLVGIEGRQEEVLHLDGVAVHPNVFHSALERLSVAGWQVNDEGDRLRVLLAGSAKIDAAGTAATVQRALEAVGVRGIRVTVDLVDTIPRTALGKAPLINRAQLATAGH